MDNVWIVAWTGEHEDWPLAIFRDEEKARAYKTVMNSSLVLVQENSFDEATRIWRALYGEDEPQATHVPVTPQTAAGAPSEAVLEASYMRGYAEGYKDGKKEADDYWNP